MIPPNVPEEEQGELNMKHLPWTVPLRRNSRGKEKGYFSYNFSSEGDIYFNAGGEVTTSNRFAALQDLQDLQDTEEEVHTEIEGKKEDSSNLCKVKHFNLSSFDNYMSNNNLLFDSNVYNNFDYVFSMPEYKINSCQGYFPEFIFLSNCIFNETFNNQNAPE